MQSAPSLDSAPHSDPSGDIAPAQSRRRIDIQVLRGVAVLMVVFYHALPDWVKGGFLGVDVFFVISGFLITGHILQDLERKRFNVGGFYVRRARRLLPAAWTTFFVTTLLAYTMLTSAQWREYLAQLVGALTFTANVVLSHQSGYFQTQAEAKPLLHIWSLSLEEQFYFVTPIVLMIVGRRLRGPALALGALASLALCILMVSGLAPHIAEKTATNLAFYMLPPRAWELLVGGLAAWLMLRRPSFSVPGWLKWTGLAVIGVLAFRQFDLVHPRGDAIAVVLATSLLLLGNDGWMRKVSAVRPIEAVGDWSYSIYLIHWPLLAFAHAGWMGDVPVAVAIGLAALSIPLGWAQYRWVEQPFQKGAAVRSPRRAAAWLAIAVAAFAAAAAPAAWASYSTRPLAAMKANNGLNKVCNARGKRWSDQPLCRTSGAPTVAVWGDSYAMHLINGLVAENIPLVQMTKSACAPALGVAQLHDSYTPSWARECAAFNESALEAIEHSPTIRTVIISSPFGQIFDPADRLFIDGQVSAWAPVAVERLTDAVRRVQASGKTVIIVAPTPHAEFDAGECNVRVSEGLPILGRRDCSIDLTASHQEQQHVIAALETVQRQTGAKIVWPEAVLCHDGRCATRVGATILYRDPGHLTPAGSVMVIRRLGLARLVGG